jgi:UDP-N-acetylglucosamine 1-carboxyvinyltransferase
VETIAVEGGSPLCGTVRVHGAKNAALPILAASLLGSGISEIEDVPRLEDIRVMMEILQCLGATVSMEQGVVRVDPSTVRYTEVPDEMMRKMRSSIFLMGPLLARFGSVKVSKPGGCTIGSRPIDLHLKGLAALGAKVTERHGYIECVAEKLTGSRIYLDIPSVGATENILMAATMARGRTWIANAAREPEIVDLANFLNAMGAHIRGAGEDTIVVEGVERLRPVRYRIIPDRIVAGTILVGAAITGGDITLTNTVPEHLGAFLTKLAETGVEIEVERDIIRVKSDGNLSAVDRVQTGYYPGFPTDMQAPFMALLSVAKGNSIISEMVFEERFKHVSELRRMGAKIKVDLRTAFIQGVPRLMGARVQATDLRAGAALLLAGMAAKGITIVENVHHIDRGYEDIERLFGQLGARIWRTRDGEDVI